MTDTPFTRRTSELLARFASLVADRAAGIDQARRHHDEAVKEATRARSEEVASAQARARLDSESLRSRHEAAIAELDRGHKSEMEAARESFGREIKEFRSRTAAIETTAARKLEDGHWLVDTMVESGEARLKKDLDAVRRSLTSLATRLDEQAAAAQTLLEKFSHRPLPPAPGDVTHWALPDDPPAMRDACEKLVRSAGESLAAMERRVKPRRLGPALFVFGPMVLLGAGAAALSAWLGPPFPRSAGIGAAAGGMISLLIFVPLRFVLRRRVSPAAAEFVRRVAEARRTIDHAIRLADAQLDGRRAALRTQAEQESARVKLEVNQLRYEAYRRKTEEEPVFVLDHESTIVRLRERIAAESAAAIKEYTDALEAIGHRRDETVARADQDLARVLEREWSTLEDTTAQLSRRWREGFEQAYAELGAIQSVAAQGSPSWEHLARDPFSPAVSVPGLVSIGSLRVDLSSLPGGFPDDPRFPVIRPTSFEVPAPLDLRERGSVLLQTGSDSRHAGLAALRAIMLRLLTSLPPAKTRFTILDPVGLGESFAGFMHLADHDPRIVGERIWTESRHIEQRLADLTEHMETVIQKYLRNEFATIQDYNEQAGEIAEPFRFLVIADFPAGFSEAAAKRLASIVAAGPRCGVFTLIAMDTRQRPPAWLPLADIERGSATFVFKGGIPSWREDPFSRWPLTLDGAPSDVVFNRLIHEVGRHAKDSGRVQVPFDTIAPRAGSAWTRSAAEELNIPIGRSGATRIQHLALGRGTAQHALIAGRTGSGKSTLLHAMITSAALWYSPDEVEMHLVDFKKGVEFKTYAAHSLPHARVIAVESEREFGLSVLRRLDAELTRRGELFRRLGVQDLAGFRRASPPPPPDPDPSPGVEDSSSAMPRILLIVDEFQEFFVADDKIAQEAALLLDRLVRQGRAFGIHVVLGSQTIGGVYSLARSTIGQMAVRIALQCSEADSYLIMSEDNAAARLLSRPGEAIYNDASGMVEGNSPFQVVWLPDEVRERHLEMVRSRAGDRRAAPIVFEGNVPSDIAANALLARSVAASGADGGGGRGGPPRAWLGEAISIKDPTCVFFKRQSSSNLIVVGQQDVPATALSIAVMVGLAATATAPSASPTGKDAVAPPITILDGSVMEEGTVSVFERAAQALPRRIRRAGVREADAFIADLYEELLRRQHPDAPEGSSLFLLVHGLQRFRSLRRSEEDFGFGAAAEGTAASTDQRFMAIIRDGPALGIHTVVWVNTAATLERALERRALREFDSRVLFQMSQADSGALIDGPQASQLGSHRALLFSEETGVLEKFRPYAPPSESWVGAVLAGLAGS